MYWGINLISEMLQAAYEFAMIFVRVRLKVNTSHYMEPSIA